MQRYLLFDSGCSVCSGLARDVENYSEGRLSAQSLSDSKVQELLEKARPGWHWEPTLLEVSDDRCKAFTGVSMRMRLLRVLGPRRSWRVVRLMARAQGAPALEGGTTRKDFIRQSGMMLAGITGLAVFGAGTAAAGEKTRRKTIEDLPHYARREGVKAFSGVEQTDTAMRVQFTHAQPARSGTLVSQGMSEPRTSFQLTRNGDSVVTVTLDKENGTFDIEDNAGRSTHFIFTEQGVFTDQGVESESASVVQQNRDDLTLAASIQSDLDMLNPATHPESNEQKQAACACDYNLSPRGVGRSASKGAACQNARQDANVSCSNCSCLGCCAWQSPVCDCLCGIGDYLCQCGITGYPCFSNCLPSCK